MYRLRPPPTPPPPHPPAKKTKNKTKQPCFSPWLTCFLNNSVRMYPIKLKIGMHDYKSNTFQNTIFQISLDMPLVVANELIRNISWVFVYANHPKRSRLRFFKHIDITYTLLYERQIPQKEKSLVFSGNTNLTNKFYRFFPGINFVIDP